MHMMKTYENLRDMLEREVTEIEQKGQLDGQSLDHLFKLMGTIKNVDKCMGYEEGNSYGRSYGMMPEMSYARDRYGRYSGDNFRDSSYRGYDRSYGNQKMRERLEMLMSEATNESERQAIMDAMNKI